MNTFSTTALPPRFLSVLLSILLMGVVVLNTHAQSTGTTFTYQGYLEEGGAPAVGSFDLRFILYDSESGGSQVGPAVEQDAVSVTDGVFAVDLDFGPVFGAGLRYLEVAVRSSGSGSYQALSPREALRPAPSAIVAQEALALPGVTVDGSGNVGIGTTSPSSPLTVAGGIESTSGGITFPDGTTQTTAGVGSGSAWQLGGNSGTDPSAGDFLGTSDDAPLELRTDGTRALRLERVRDTRTFSSVNVIAGAPVNSVSSDVVGATISGGGYERSSSSTVAANQVEADYGTVSGGHGNTASGERSTVGGGSNNIASGENATVGGGGLNTASGLNATVGGGVTNETQGVNATVGGGFDNVASGAFATVPGGFQNVASGDYSFAAGIRAEAQHDYSFVWSAGANQGDGVTSTGLRQFIVSAPGGFYLTKGARTPPGGLTQFLQTSTGAYLSNGGTWTNSSSRTRKEAFRSVDFQTLLEKVGALPITRWRYQTGEEGPDHLGPMAEDFHAIFGLGDDPKTISTVDADGVALAAIQGLLQRLEAQATQLRSQQRRIRTYAEQIESMEERLGQLERVLLDLGKTP